MAEITLDFLGQRLADIQGEQRTMRMQLDLMRGQLGDAATKQDLAHVVDVIADRINATDRLIEARFAEITAKLNH